MKNIMAIGFLSLILSSTVNAAQISEAEFKEKQAPGFSLQEKLADLEASANGRIGFYAFDTGNGKTLRYRHKERFAFCSTFKTLVAAAILQKNSHNPVLMQQRVFYKKTDLVAWSPVTEKKENIATGMTWHELCAAVTMQGDNTAANLLIRELGGPEALTAFARSLDDRHFRLDRYEPELNSAEPGDERDTTTPEAMAKTLYKLVLGGALAPDGRQQLQLWMKNNTTGTDSIRAGMPAGWVAGDRTGSGMYGTTNAIAVLWPLSGGAPRVVVIFFTGKKQDAPSRRDILAETTRVMMKAFDAS